MCFVFVHSTSRSTEQSFLILYGTPAMPVKTFTIIKGERLDTDLSSVEWIIKKRGQTLSVDYARSLTSQSRFLGLTAL